MARSARSVRFRALERSLKTLKSHLLPSSLSATGNYTQAEYIRAAAFRVLAHAELEAYFEDRVWDVALKSVQRLKSSGKSSRVVLALLAFSGLKLEGPPDQLSPPPGVGQNIWSEKVELENKLDAALAAFKRVIDGNHGVREKNLLGLLLPVGVGPAELDATWLATIDSFGERRGTYAHRSYGAYGTTHVPDPGTELSTAETIVQGVHALDAILSRLL